MEQLIRRRQVLHAAGAALGLASLPGCITRAGLAGSPGAAGHLNLAPILATIDRINRITVCTRPFRAAGPRLDVEQVGNQTVVHNYGHGGSGWSLSWGSSSIAAQRAMATGARDIAVIGCGALGLTSALALQRMGARVTIYAKDLPPNVRSSLATGVWSPDSRICLQEQATPAFKRLWEDMTRESFQTYQTLLGLPGNPVEFIQMYGVRDQLDSPGSRGRPVVADRPAFAELASELVPDLSPRNQVYRPGTHPLGQRYLYGSPQLMFNISGYARMLVSDFIAAGGTIQVTQFDTVEQLATLPQKTLINATGYGARALFADQSVVPVRGQLARMAPQPDVDYGLYYHRTAFVPRRDGVVFQVTGDSDYYGYGDDTTTPDRAEAERAVTTIASLYA